MTGIDLILKPDDSIWLTKQLPNFKQGSSQLQLLFNASRDGWQATDFHKICDNKGPTLTVIKSSVGKICGGYASVSWKSEGGNTKDPESFIFSLDSKTVYKPFRDESDLYFGADQGPCFGYNSLNLYSTRMNEKNGGYCYTNGTESSSHYKIGCDSEGNSVITGEGKEQKGNDKKRYTCVALEVYKVIY